MKIGKLMRELEALGTAQNRKVYARHGVGAEMYGVSFANLRKLHKRIKTDHSLACELWRSGNHDARILATLIADPQALDSRTLDRWARELDNYVVTDSFSGLVARSGMGRRKFEQWRSRKSEWVGQAAWNLLTSVAMHDDELPDRYFEEQLATLEREVHGRKNRVRYAMNQALIAIGTRNRRLERKVIAAAGRIGPIEVDHGETGCKTPDPIPYIQRVKAHRQKLKKKQQQQQKR